MEQYKASIQSVDDALARLNATLASYKLTNAVSEPPVKHESQEQPFGNGADNSVRWRAPQEVRGTLKHQIYQISLKVAYEQWDWDRWLDAETFVSQNEYRDIRNDDLREMLLALNTLFELVEEHPYCLAVYLELAGLYVGLGHPDLAAGAAYKALLLSDAIRDDSDEYHEQAYGSFKAFIERVPGETRMAAMDRIHDEVDKGMYIFLTDADALIPGEPVKEAIHSELMIWFNHFYQRITYKVLIECLMLCGDLEAAGVYMNKIYPTYEYDDHFTAMREDLLSKVSQRFGKPWEEISKTMDKFPASWPTHCQVRREVYPWNEYQPDRFAKLDDINRMMEEVAPKLEIRAVELPALTGDGETGISRQLGVFALEDIEPGEVVLDESSLLTVNNRLQDTLCDACSGDLPELNGEGADAVVACPECEIIFCSETCFEAAYDNYHQALCERDVDAIGKDPDPEDAADSLYALLLQRCFALAEGRDCHPLDLKEVKYIWGDFDAQDLSESFKMPDPAKPESAFGQMPRTLPFRFEFNIRLPFHILEKMDIDIFATTRYDVWVFNTLYAKFRGTASARLSGAGNTTAKGPEVCAVHPMWCMANHSCDPNVSWEWGGSIKLSARKDRATWQGNDGRTQIRSSGLKAGEEVLNHYCDIDLPVKERREWARGALGGDCRCERCMFEATDWAGKAAESTT